MGPPCCGGAPCESGALACSIACCLPCVTFAKGLPESVVFDPCEHPRLDLDLSKWPECCNDVYLSDDEDDPPPLIRPYEKPPRYPATRAVVERSEAVARRNAIELAQHCGYDLEVTEWPVAQGKLYLPVPQHRRADALLHCEGAFQYGDEAVTGVRECLADADGVYRKLPCDTGAGVQHVPPAPLCGIELDFDVAGDGEGHIHALAGKPVGDDHLRANNSKHRNRDFWESREGTPAGVVRVHRRLRTCLLKPDTVKGALPSDFYTGCCTVTIMHEGRKYEYHLDDWRSNDVVIPLHIHPRWRGTTVYELTPYAWSVLSGSCDSHDVDDDVPDRRSALIKSPVITKDGRSVVSEAPSVANDGVVVDTDLNEDAYEHSPIEAVDQSPISDDIISLLSPSGPVFSPGRASGGCGGGASPAASAPRSQGLYTKACGLSKQSKCIPVIATKAVIADTGSAYDLVSKPIAEKHASAISSCGSNISLATAKGVEKVGRQMALQWGSLEGPTSALVLDNTPSVVSIGKRCLQAHWGFHWPAGSQSPYFIRSDGSKVFMKVNNFVPYLPEYIEPSPCSCIALPAPDASNPGGVLFSLPPRVRVRMRALTVMIIMMGMMIIVHPSCLSELR